ncbi:MAG: hypothetical protein NDI61_07940 [Bdellovibrionaceae bacterium]|nr:hypothetical protein [Pseudobdellovibrionaceae bacterium]
MNSNSMEREIRQLLNQSGSADQVADELLGRWAKNLFSADEQRSVAQFLLNAGLHQRLLGEIHRLLKDRHFLPWAQFAECLMRSRLALNDDDVRAILEGLEEQGAYDDLLACKAADDWSKTIRDKRRTWDAKKALRLAEKKTALTERLQFFRANSMYEEEAATLEQLRALFPDDKAYNNENEDFQLRWARDVIAKHGTFRTDLSEEWAQRARQLTPEIRSLKDLFLARCSELAIRYPFATYDLALFLVFMEFYSEALEVLSLAKPHEPRMDWLRLELLLLARHFVTALEEANRLEVLYAGQPDCTFAVVYARARALWGLGQGHMAIDLMRSLVNVRPQYKSASSLLADWQGGDS